MHVVIVDFTVKPEARQSFAAAVKEQARVSLETEDGCHQFDVAWSDNAPDSVFLYEIHDSAEAFAAHLKTAHFAAFDTKVAPMIVSKQVRQMTRRFP